MMESIKVLVFKLVLKIVLKIVLKDVFTRFYEIESE